MKAAGATSKAPLKEAFGEWRNLKLVLIALFGAVAGQAVIGFAAHLYPLFYLERVAKVDGATANFLVATALLLIIPSFVFRSEEHTSELQSLMRISFAVFCLKKNKHITLTPL